MRITERMINWLMLPEELQEAGLGRYMEYPVKGSRRRYVIQHHWRGRSVHKDFRMEMNDHLTGWSILDNPSGTPEVQTMEDARAAYKKLDWALDPKNPNKGLRAETKARQPKDWLTVEGVTKPGEVGATKGEEGVLHIVDHGTFWEGAQKCFAYNTKVITQNRNGHISRRSIGSIIRRKENVEILTPSGFQGIKHFIEKDLEGNPFKIILDNGSNMIVDKMHPTWRYRNGILEKVPCSKLEKGDLIPIFSEGYDGLHGTYDMGRFLGLYIAEGNIPKGYEENIRLAFHEDEKDLIKFVSIYASRLGSNARVDKNKYNRGVQVTLTQASALVGLIRQFLNEDGTFRSKIYGLSSETRKGILDGITQGDGHCYSSYTLIEMGKHSKKLVEDIRDLIVSVGDIPSFRKTKDSFKVTYNLHNFEKGNWHQYIINDQRFIKVRKIEELPRTFNKVYDVELNEDHRIVLANGIITSNTYFHEYFVKSDQENGVFPKGKWTRIIIRAVNVARIDPETKLPGKTKELMWRAMIPSSQGPYAIDRGLKKKWRAPKEVTPFPKEWVKVTWPKEYKEWLEFMTGKKVIEK